MDSYSIISVESKTLLSRLRLKIPLDVAKTVKTLVAVSKETDTYLYDLVYNFPSSIPTSEKSWKAYCGWKRTGDVADLDKDDLVMLINIITHMESIHNPAVKPVIKKYVNLWFSCDTVESPSDFSKSMAALTPLKKDLQKVFLWAQFHEEFQNPRFTKVLEEYMTKTQDDWINTKCSHEKKYRLIHTLIDARVELDQHATPDSHYNTTIWNFFNRDANARSETECLIAMTYRFFENEPQRGNTTRPSQQPLKMSYKKFFSTCPTFAKDIWTIYNKFFFECLTIKADNSCKTIEKKTSYEEAIKYIFNVVSIEPAPWDIVRSAVDYKESELIRICNEIIENQNARGYIGQSEELVMAKHALKSYRNSKK